MSDVFAILVQGFNGADLRNVCTEAGMAAIRAERDYVIHEDFMKVSSFFEESYFSVYQLCTKGLLLLVTHRHNNLTSFFGSQAVRKLNDAKKLESSAHYSADFGKD